MERVGKVIEKRGNKAMVVMRRHSACDKCGRCGGILGGPDIKDSHVMVENPIGAGAGELVKIEVDDGKLLLMSFVLYMVPVLALVAGILLGTVLAPAINYTGDHIFFSVGSGLLLAAIVMIWIKYWDKSKKDDTRYKPVITSLAGEDDIE